MPKHSRAEARRTRALGLGLAAAWIAAASPSGPAVAQSLTVGVGAAVTSIDPHYHNLAPNLSMGTKPDASASVT